MIRVFLADDHELFRDGLRRILAASGGFEIVGEAVDVTSTLEGLSTVPCDVLLLDLAMPGGGGTEVLRLARAAHPKLAIVVLSMFAEDQHAARLIAAGASAYLTKGRSSAELLSAIRKVAGGGRYVTDTIAERVLAGMGSPADPLPRLTPREHQVYLLIAQGRTPSEIAGTLDLAPSTVSTYIARIKTALDAESLGDIVRYAARTGAL